MSFVLCTVVFMFGLLAGWTLAWVVLHVTYKAQILRWIRRWEAAEARAKNFKQGCDERTKLIGTLMEERYAPEPENFSAEELLALWDLR